MKEVFAYALIKALDDEGHDYLDTFSGLTIKAMPPETEHEIVSIQKYIKQEYALRADIPIYVLESILKKAMGKKYVTQSVYKGDPTKGLERRVAYKILKKGAQYRKEIEDLGVEDKIVDLSKNICLYAKNKWEIEITPKVTRKIFLAFIIKNLRGLVQYMNHGIFSGPITVPIDDKEYNRIFIEYINFIRKESSEKYFKILCDIICGSIISTILYSKTSDVVRVPTRRMEKTIAYLDSNFALSLLKLHSPEQNKSAEELFAMLRDNNIEARIFDFTVREICTVVSKYLVYRNNKRFYMAFRGFGLFQRLECMGWGRLQVRQFISKIDTIFAKMEVKIERGPEDVESYVSTDNEVVQLFAIEKPKHSVMARSHDLAAIKSIKEIRKKRCKSETVSYIEKAKVFFLTSDKVLSKFNYENMGHSHNGTICEVIFDRLLANILWLKNSQFAVPLQTIIAANSREMFVNEKVWEKFSDLLISLYEAEDVTTADVVDLFYNTQIEDMLSDISEDEIDQTITKDTVKCFIEEASKQADTFRKITFQKEKNLKSKINELNEALKTKGKEVAISKALIEEKVDELKSKIQHVSRSQAREYTLFILVGMNLIFIVFSGILFATNKFGLMLFPILPLVIGDVLSFLGVWPWNTITEKLNKRLYHKLLSQTQIDQMQI